MDKLFEHNEGLPSRFPQIFKFPDYTDEELLEILNGIIKGHEGGKFRLEDQKYARIQSKRLGKQRGMTGFGNARAVRTHWEKITLNRQAKRITKARKDGFAPDVFLIEVGLRNGKTTNK